jgi:hypothetical protein
MEVAVLALKLESTRGLDRPADDEGPGRSYARFARIPLYTIRTAGSSLTSMVYIPL